MLFQENEIKNQLDTVLMLSTSLNPVYGRSLLDRTAISSIPVIKLLTLFMRTYFLSSVVSHDSRFCIHSLLLPFLIQTWEDLLFVSRGLWSQGGTSSKCGKVTLCSTKELRCFTFASTEINNNINVSKLRYHLLWFGLLGF